MYSFRNTNLSPFLLATSYGRRKSNLFLLITQTSILLPEPRSLYMPAAMASLTSCLASSSWKSEKSCHCTSVGISQKCLSMWWWKVWTLRTINEIDTSAFLLTEVPQSINNSLLNSGTIYRDNLSSRSWSTTPQDGSDLVKTVKEAKLRFLS